MSSEPNQKKAQSTYFVQERHSREELTRLTIQEQMITQSMGGVLPEQSDPGSFQRVLDVACGPGGWAIDAAKAFATMSLVGVDINEKTVIYARGRAQDEQVAGRVTFQQMDVLRALTFPDASFDLLNMRLAVSFVRTWDWPKLLSEFQRVVRYGGIIRLTEADIAEGNSPGLTTLNQLLRQSFYNAGNFFALQNDGLTSQLAPLLTRHGLKDVQQRTHQLVYRAGTPAGKQFARDMQHLYRTVQPFIQKWIRIPADYEQAYEQALNEMQEPGFVATWNFVTAWGVNNVPQKESAGQAEPAEPEHP